MSPSAKPTIARPVSHIGWYGNPVAIAVTPSHHGGVTVACSAHVIMFLVPCSDTRRRTAD